MAHNTSNRHRSPAWKVAAVGAVGLLLGIPLLCVGVLQWERESRSDEATAAVAVSHGGPQRFYGPLLRVPYVREVSERVYENGQSVLRTREVREALFVAPGRLDVRVGQKTQVLHRAIYEIPTLVADIGVDASFPVTGLEQLPEGARLEPERAEWWLGLGDLGGVGTVALAARGEPIPFEAHEGSGWANLRAPATLRLDAEGRLEAMEVAGSVSLRGVDALSIGPGGAQTEVQWDSDWPDPSFGGAYLPFERSVSESGFSARWEISPFARGAPRVVAGSDFYPGMDRVAEVRLIRPTEGYHQVRRSLKYALGFVGLVLVLFLGCELSSGVRVHPAQYALLGMAQVSFYLLLLALSEHIGITWAYLLAGAATTALSGLYAIYAFGHRRFGLLTLGAVGTSYLFQWVLVRVEHHALLLGALLCFFTIAGLMHATRRVRWYAPAPSEEA